MKLSLGKEYNLNSVKEIEVTDDQERFEKIFKMGRFSKFLVAATFNLKFSYSLFNLIKTIIHGNGLIQGSTNRPCTIMFMLFFYFSSK